MEKTILIADDDPELLSAYERMARKRDFQVLTCADGAEALSLALANRPDIIILDVRMPKPDGRDVISKLKKDPATSQTPVLIISSVETEDVREVCIRYGADDYLIKPVDFELLFRKIARLLVRQPRGAE